MSARVFVGMHSDRPWISHENYFRPRDSVNRRAHEDCFELYGHQAPNGQRLSSTCKWTHGKEEPDTEQRDKQSMQQMMDGIADRQVAAGRADNENAQRSAVPPLRRCGPQDRISLGFEFPIPEGYFKDKDRIRAHEVNVETMLRGREGMVPSIQCFFITCALAKISTLKKLLMTKLALSPPTYIEVAYGGEILPDDYKLSDIVDIFLGGEKKYLHFYFQPVTPSESQSATPTLPPEGVPTEAPKVDDPKQC
ncbi:hypothetical protein M513_04664 [Trichuris suis]|uniref:Ubiquitin-like domain-containing protein n=1 Tax=Trichuris suis TaxID=68888 RepID=A0A085MBC1_9BILA|nr:hypothetical protein M513_04664 [Trichuris suis]